MIAPLLPAGLINMVTGLPGEIGDPGTGGVDQHGGAVVTAGAVHGVDGLYVMDASVFPTNTGVNPQHSIMSIATVAATRIAS